MGQAIFAAEKCRARVDRHDIVPLRRRSLVDGREFLNAGVVAQDIDPAKTLHGAADQSADLRLATHIGEKIDRVTAQGPQCRHNPVPFAPVQTADRHAIICFDELARDPKTDARIPAGHEEHRRSVQM